MIKCAHCGEEVDWKSGVTWRSGSDPKGILAWHAHESSVCYVKDSAATLPWPEAHKLVTKRGADRLASYIPW